jgi:hypothetical protein
MKHLKRLLRDVQKEGPFYLPQHQIRVQDHVLGINNGCKLTSAIRIVTLCQSRRRLARLRYGLQIWHNHDLYALIFSTS